MEIQDYKEISRGALASSFSLYIKEWGMTIRNCTWFQKDGRSWLSFPSRPYEDAEGKKKYFSFILLDDKVKIKFENAVREELKKLEKLEKHESPTDEAPDYFDSEEAPF